MFYGRGGSFPSRRFHSSRPIRINERFPDVVRSPSPPVGNLIGELKQTIPEDDGTVDENTKITNCAYIASFNWVDGSKPRILIPGSPPAWTPPADKIKLNEDKGDFFRDPNAARFPNHPMAPAVRAVLAENPELITQEIDIFACTSTLGSLMRFVRHDEKPFRFLVEVVGKTVFFIRHENSPTELIPGVRGYGHTFPEACTTWDPDVKGSVSHQRLVRYDLAGLDCVVRFQCDGYLKDKVESKSSATSKKTSIDVEKNEQALNAEFKSFKLMQSPSRAFNHETSVDIKRSGQKIPQEAVFDLKTRSSSRLGLHVLEDELPRLWIAQIPNFILAYHTRGVFETPVPKAVRNDVQEWEGEHRDNIFQFGCLLRKIISAAKARGDCKLEVCRKRPDALELREQGASENSVLPLELKARWMMEESTSDTTGSVDGVCFSTPDDSDDDSEKDYTACSAEDCGYCGRCSY